MALYCAMTIKKKNDIRAFMFFRVYTHDFMFDVDPSLPRKYSQWKKNSYTERQNLVSLNKLIYSLYQIFISFGYV